MKLAITKKHRLIAYISVCCVVKCVMMVISKIDIEQE